MSINLQIGLDIITSYKRLSYTAWHALAEFVDNSTQAYEDNRDVLDNALAQKGEVLTVSIVYDKTFNGGRGLIRIYDNAMGMSYDELQRALHVGQKPKHLNGRSQYGMGMKTAACWLGDKWTIRTKKLGEALEHKVEVDVQAIAAGRGDLPYTSTERPLDDHFTVLEITNLHREFPNRTIGKIREFLSSMYRQDFRTNKLRLECMDVVLAWDEYDSVLLKAADGSQYKRTFEFEVYGKRVEGWAGVLDKGSRSKAGFSILHRNRVIQGWPDAWRPQTIFGQYLGSNDLINQRVVGEIHLDAFLVSHTKDDILWLNDEQELVEQKLYEVVQDLIHIAKTHRKRNDSRGPTEAETKTAVEELVVELKAPEMVDQISLEPVPAELTKAAKESVVKTVKGKTASFSAKCFGQFEILGYLESLSFNDPYVTNDIGEGDKLLVVINTSHPHWLQLKGSEGVLNYLRHCIYDAISEWKASKLQGKIDPDTVKVIKDRLLRLSMIVEMHDE